MTPALLVAMFGAIVALVTREGVDTHKARKQRRAADDVTLRAIKQELVEIKTCTARNLVDLWDRKEIEFRHRHTLRWEATTDPLFPMSNYLEHLMRQDSSVDLLGNIQVLRLFSSIAGLITNVRLLDEQRMRYLSAQYRVRTVHPDSNEVAETVEKWEDKLLRAHQLLLIRTLQALSVAELVEGDRFESRRFRIRFGSFYEPTASERQALDELIEDTDAFELYPSWRPSRGQGHTIFIEYGYAENRAGEWLATARGRIVAGSNSRFWHRPRTATPPEKRVDWTTFDPLDYL